MSWSATDVFAAIAPVVEVLESLGVRYRIGGSLASSALGLPRSTLDADIACELGLDDVEAFVAQLQDQYYVDTDMIRDAIRRRSWCDLIHNETIVKVDLFIREDRPFAQVAFERLDRRPLEANAREYDLTTAEDIVLHELEYRDGNRVSERPWRDVIGVLQVQRGALDLEYLRHWAGELDVTDRLEQALREAA